MSRASRCTHTQVHVCDGGSCRLTPRQAARSAPCPLLAAAWHPDPSPASPSPSSPGRMQVRGLLLLLALILLAATAEAGKNKKGEGLPGTEGRGPVAAWGVLPCPHSEHPLPLPLQRRGRRMAPSARTGAGDLVSPTARTVAWGTARELAKTRVRSSSARSPATGRRSLEVSAW